MKPWIRKAHRWLGLIFSLTLLMSSGSGVLHTVMTRTQAPPPAARPGNSLIDPASIKLTAPDAMAKLPGEATAINLRMIAGQPHYQIFTAKGKPGYVNAVTGAVDPAADEIYAGEIASAFLGGTPVKKTDYLTAFNREYIGIFRLLPVYRFDAGDGDGNRVYVSTVTGSVTRHTDDGKQFEADIFTLFHKFGFIKNKDIRDWSLTLVTGGTFAVSLLGVALFFMTRPRKRKG
ncbi:PepSY domain-containing protein [Luteolibacter yonseiensis]|uniref:PepSY domain-containing protein n=1 Tax=Luteolibacter yonseiensis TaxID=1144680 RepID=A0A934R1R4_9BACT|nr:PepSY domain-containing protein [Luteolibacter yonseiensis]MBK1815172.1 PepSY domain-containing protein [Luteolibacter yonseiensis]